MLGTRSWLQTGLDLFQPSLDDLGKGLLQTWASCSHLQNGYLSVPLPSAAGTGAETSPSIRERCYLLIFLKH